MKVCATLQDLRGVLRSHTQTGRAVALVPTMGALHRGHGALLERARGETDVVVASIFVNPTQFDRPEDYEAYTRSSEHDLTFCRARGVDVVFMPTVEEMYPRPSETWVEVPSLAQHLCGSFRPRHFRGVATVVAKLFHIVEPQRAYFGEKDAQQLAVISRMVADLNFPVEIVRVPTVREPDGLALSSRNARLSAEERRIAPLLYWSLERARDALAESPEDVVRARDSGVSLLGAEPAFRLEYFDIVDAATLQPVTAGALSSVLIAAAAWLGRTRLIDNLSAL